MPRPADEGDGQVDHDPATIRTDSGATWKDRVKGLRGIHLSGPYEKEPRDAVVVARFRQDLVATPVTDAAEVFRSSHCCQDLQLQFLRSSQTTPATAPRIITAPMAMNQVIMPKIAPTVPYVLLSETIVSEK